MLNPYYHRIQAVRITKKNYQKLKELDTSDGVLCDEFGSPDDFIGDWFIYTRAGFEIMSGDVELIPIKE